MYAGAVGVAAALGDRVKPPENGGRLPWDTDRLAYSVREPFPSQVTGCSLVHGFVSDSAPLTIRSHMAAGGVIFSDGVESDYIDFNAGTEVAIGLAAKKARLLDRIH